jgi:hypothetical protein
MPVLQLKLNRSLYGKTHSYIYICTIDGCVTSKLDRAGRFRACGGSQLYKLQEVMGLECEHLQYITYQGRALPQLRIARLGSRCLFNASHEYCDPIASRAACNLLHLDRAYLQSHCGVCSSLVCWIFKLNRDHISKNLPPPAGKELRDPVVIRFYHTASIICRECRSITGIHFCSSRIYAASLC